MGFKKYEIAMSNSFGILYRLSSFGESHGEAVGGVIDGMPSGLLLDIDAIQKELNRRRPGQLLTTTRTENDKLEILSGLMDGVTTGMPLAFMVRNYDQRSGDYEKLKNIYRPSHADYTWQAKYGVRDYRGGGRSSAREHIGRVVAGAVAKQILSAHDISITAHVSQVGDAHLQAEMEFLTERVRLEGDSIGGVVSCSVKGVPVGLGEPVFGKFQSLLAGAMMSINAAKGFEYGMGFGAASMRGSEHNDRFVKIGVTERNLAGGILGGVASGEEIYFRVAFKPASSIAQKQITIDENGNSVEIEIGGRHDPCVAWRAVPVVEAMTAMVTLDLLLLSKTH